MLVVPRIPSVPKNLRVMRRVLARLSDPAPDSCRNGVSPGRNQEQQRPADDSHGPGISKPAGERHERGLRGPVVPVLAHLTSLLAVLTKSAAKRHDDDG